MKPLHNQPTRMGWCRKLTVVYQEMPVLAWLYVRIDTFPFVNGKVFFVWQKGR